MYGGYGNLKKLWLCHFKWNTLLWKQALVNHQNRMSKENGYSCHLVGRTVVSTRGVLGRVALPHHVGHTSHPLQTRPHLLHPQLGRKIFWSRSSPPHHRHMVVRQSGTAAWGCNTKLCRDFVRYSISQLFGLAP